MKQKKKTDNAIEVGKEKLSEKSDKLKTAVKAGIDTFRKEKDSAETAEEAKDESNEPA